jgi:PAS domain S-box-containing protein
MDVRIFHCPFSATRYPPPVTSRFSGLSRDELVALLESAERRGLLDGAPAASAEHRIGSDEQRLRLLMEASNDGVWEWNILTNEVFWSDRTYQMLGIERGQFGGDFSFVEQLLHPEDKALMAEALRRHLEEHVPYRVDLRFRRPDGSYGIFHASGSALRDADGRPTHMAGSLADVESVRRQERLLQESQSMARIGGWELDLTTNRLFWTAETCRIHGVSPETFKPRPEHMACFFTPESRRGIEERLRRGTEHGEPWDIEGDAVDSEGRLLRLRSCGRAERQQGRIVRLYGALQDITDRHVARQTLQEVEARHTDLVNSLDGIFWEADAQTLQFTFVSEQAERILGYPVSAWFQKDFWPSKIHPEDREQTVRYCAAQTARLKAHDFEYRMVAADGRILWIRDIVSITAEDGRPRLLRGVMVEVTRLKAIEAALRHSEGRFRAIFNSAFQFVGLLQPDGAVVEANDTSLRYLEGRRSEVIGQALWDTPWWRHSPALQARLRDSVERANRGRTVRFEAEHPSKNGETITVDFSLKPVKDDTGAVVLLLAESRDITERKEAERALAVSEERYATVFRNSPDAITLTRLRDGLIMETNEGFARIFGIPVAEAVGQSSLALGVWADPEDRRRMVETLLAGKRVNAWELRFNRRSGVVGTALFSADTVEIGGEKLAVTLVRDITARIEAEAELEESRRRFLTLLGNLPGMAYRCLNDAQWTMELVSEGARELLGYAPDDLIGNRTVAFADLIHPDDRERVAQETGPALSTGRKFELTYRVRTRDGVEKWVWERGQGVPSADGAVHIEGFLSDITERRRVEDSMRFSEERYRLLVENSSDLVAEITLDGRFLYVSPTFRTRLGYIAAELVHTDIASHIHPEDLPASVMAFMRAETSEVFRFRHQDGSWRWLEAHGRDYKTSGGEDRGVIIARDITERRQGDEARASLEAQLRQAQKMEAIGTLAGGIAHDFNNILAAMLAYTELARMDVDEGTQVREHLDLIVKSGDRARHLVSQILAFSRKQKNERHVIRLQTIVREVLKMLRSTLPATIEIVQDIGSDAETVLADPNQIHQILLNLCTNAAHAMPDGRGRLEVSIGAVDVTAALAAGLPELQPGPHVRLVVRDNGLGMTEETAKRIFEPFFTTKPPGEGTGLGLSVVHGIIEDHDGAIRVSSEHGVGTVFEIYFPVHKLDTEILDAATASLRKGQGQRILFVDDEAAICSSVEKLLGRLGFQVNAVNDPEQALALFKVDPYAFDVVVTDLSMPGLTGIDLAARLVEARPQVPIILVTGFSGTWTPEKVRELGIQELVQKPVSPAALSAAIHRVLS